MENDKPKTGNRKPARSKNKPVVTTVTTTEAGSPLMFVTIEEHEELLNEKISQIISLENGLRANESLSKSLNAQLSAQKFAEGKLKHDIEYAEKQLKRLTDNLNKIPTWIKKLFKAL